MLTEGDRQMMSMQKSKIPFLYWKDKDVQTLTKNLPIHRGLLDFQYSGVGDLTMVKGKCRGGGVKTPVGAMAMRNSEKVWIQLGGFQFSLIGVKRFGE